MAPSCIRNGYNININMYQMYIQNVRTKCTYKMYIKMYTQNVHLMYTFDILVYKMGTKLVLKTTVPLKIWIRNEHTIARSCIQYAYKIESSAAMPLKVL